MYYFTVWQVIWFVLLTGAVCAAGLQVGKRCENRRLRKEMKQAFSADLESFNKQVMGEFGNERTSGFRYKLGRKPTLGEVILCTVIITSAIAGLIICW